MPSLVERDRPDYAADGDSTSLITLGDAFRNERWMVILGDPGSGKTTLARWLTLKLSMAFLKEEPSVVVPAYQIDPNVDKTSKEMVNIGPTRLPVLLRISEFSEAYQKARKELTTLSVVDFLGYHSWLGQKSNLKPAALNSLIKQYLRQGRAVIILDGMDEVTTATHRDDVVRSIETFINDWINGQGDFTISAKQKNLYWSPSALGPPHATGGNQIIITSRIAGYQAAPITGQVAHVTIQPMQRVAVEHFCDSWTLATYPVPKAPDEPEELVKEKAAREADGLKAAIFDPLRPRVRELASNPLLVTILALVYRNNRGRLPEQRSELYHTAMEILIEEWRTSGLTTVDLIYVLSPLAAHIHQNYSTGLIEESEMKEIITEELVHLKPQKKGLTRAALVKEVDEFLRKVREDVGLLSERSENLYGFLHLTFQEYLSALFLVRDEETEDSVKKIISKLDDPRWREPILMSLGHISANSNWGPRTRQKLLQSLLEADDPLKDLIPRSALLIVSAIPEMAKVSEQIINEIIRRLLATYADREGVGEFESLRERIQKGLVSLYESNHRPILERYLIQALNDIQENRNLALAAADLIARNQWSGYFLTQALVKAHPYDAPDWKFPINSALYHLLELQLKQPDKPLIKPERSKEESQNLEKLRAQMKRIEDGSFEKELLERIAALEIEDPPQDQ